MLRNVYFKNQRCLLLKSPVALLPAGASWRYPDSPRGGVRQHDPPQPPPPPPPSHWTPRRVWGLRLLEPNHRFQSWWQQKIWAVCEVHPRASVAPPFLCCHQWRATAKVRQPSCAANKPLVRAVCRHNMDTAFFCPLFLSVCPSLSPSLSGRDPSQRCPASPEESRRFVIPGPVFGTWSLQGNKRRTACHLDPVYYPKKREIWFIYSANVSFTSVWNPPSSLLKLFLLFLGLEHTLYHTNSSHSINYVII